MTKDNETSYSEKNHEISLLTSLSPDSIQALREHWIETIEQFVAIASTLSGREGLSKILRSKPIDLDVLLSDSEKIIGDLRYHSLMIDTPGGPLGAHFTEKDRAK